MRPYRNTYGRQRRKKKKPPLRIFENFYQHAFGTFTKPHKPTHNPSFAKEPNFTSSTKNSNFAKVKNSNFFISFLLLLTYTFGFAHNLIPHCQELATGQQQNISHHHHKHHDHKSDVKPSSKHDHIVHEGHYDENIYDLIVCFLSEMEHPADDDCHVSHYIQTNLNNDLTKQVSKTKIIAILVSVFSFTDQRKSLSEYNSEDAVQYSSPPLGNSPNRGPPSISC